VKSGECIFCDIVAGRADASFVYRDELCSAFMDIQPVNPGHVLVVPNGHASDLAETAPATWSRIAEVARKIGAVLRTSNVRCEGVNLFLADGEAAGQEVFHAHLHVFPRFSGDGFGLRFPDSYRDLPARAELQAVARSLESRLSSTSDAGAL